MVVAGVHGDERSGIRAVNRLREADLDLQRGVVFVLANPTAIEKNGSQPDSASSSRTLSGLLRNRPRSR